MIEVPEQPTVVVLGAGGMGAMAARVASTYADLGQLVVADVPVTNLPAEYRTRGGDRAVIAVIRRQILGGRFGPDRC